MLSINALSGGEPRSKSIVSFDARIPVYKMNSATKMPAQPSTAIPAYLPTSEETSTKVVVMASLKLSADDAFNAFDFIKTPILR